MLKQCCFVIALVANLPSPVHGATDGFADVGVQTETRELMENFKDYMQKTVGLINLKDLSPLEAITNYAYEVIEEFKRWHQFDPELGKDFIEIALTPLKEKLAALCKQAFAKRYTHEPNTVPHEAFDIETIFKREIERITARPGTSRRSLILGPAMESAAEEELDALEAPQSPFNIPYGFIDEINELRTNCFRSIKNMKAFVAEHADSSLTFDERNRLQAEITKVVDGIVAVFVDIQNRAAAWLNNAECSRLQALDSTTAEEVKRDYKNQVANTFISLVFGSERLISPSKLARKLDKLANHCPALGKPIPSWTLRTRIYDCSRQPSVSQNLGFV